MVSRRPNGGGVETRIKTALSQAEAQLNVRDEWGEWYDPDDFRAREAFLLDVAMLGDSIDSIVSSNKKREALVEAKRTQRIAEALNRLQAYTYHAEQEPEQSLLRLEQIPFMRDICDFFEHDAFERAGGFAVIPTGVGKTVLFNELVHTTGLRTLVIADTNEQVSNNQKKLHEHARGREVDSGIIDKSNKKTGEHVTYTTYASLLKQMRLPPNQRLIKPEEYDMVIYDEAHLLLGENRRTTLKEFTHAIKLAFTATDRYTDDKQLSILLPHEITRMTLEEAEDKQLVAPHHNIIVQTRADMRNVPVASTGDYAQDILFESINTDERNLVAVETYQKLFYGKKVIDFCGGIQHAKDLAKMYNEHGIPAAAVWGDMPDDDRREVFKKFREGKLMHVTNADLITTGFDMQSVECVFMLQPSLSELRVTQIGGRSNRLWELLADKVSYVVQYIDDHYTQPPVIFAEIGVSGHAQHGWDGFIFPAIDTSDMSFTVVTDPIEVEWIALQHHEARNRRNLPPPDGWASFDDLQQLSRRPMSHLKKSLADFRAAQEKLRDEHKAAGTEPEDGELLDLNEHLGSFLNPKVDGGRKSYLSPELVTRMSEHLKKYRVKESTMWRRPVEAQAIFDKSTSWVSNILLWGARTEPANQHEAKLVESPESTRELLYFHYDLYVTGANKNQANVNIRDLIEPPERLESESNVRDEINQTYGEGSYELALSRSGESPLGWGNKAGSIAYEVDDEIVQYYPRKAKDRLIKRLKPDTRGRLSPLNDLLQRKELVDIGVTSDEIQKAAEALLDKSPDLGWKVGRYWNESTKQFEYFGLREIHVHIFEKLFRAHYDSLDPQKLYEELLRSSALRRPLKEGPASDHQTNQSPQTPPQPAEKPRQKTKPAEKPNVSSEVNNPRVAKQPTAKDKKTLAKINRAKDLLHRLRQLQQD